MPTTILFYFKLFNEKILQLPISKVNKSDTQSPATIRLYHLTTHGFNSKIKYFKTRKTIFLKAKELYKVCKYWRKTKINLTPKSAYKTYPTAMVSGNRHRIRGQAGFGVDSLVADKIRAVSAEICEGDAAPDLTHRLRGKEARVCWSRKARALVLGIHILIRKKKGFLHI